MLIIVVVLMLITLIIVKTEVGVRCSKKIYESVLHLSKYNGLKRILVHLFHTISDMIAFTMQTLDQDCTTFGRMQIVVRMHAWKDFCAAVHCFKCFASLLLSNNC